MVKYLPYERRANRMGTDTKLTMTYNDRHICFRIADAHGEQIALGEKLGERLPPSGGES